jgi:cholesterol transport system auxiliary component
MRCFIHGLLAALIFSMLNGCSSTPNIQNFDFGTIVKQGSASDDKLLAGLTLILPEIRVPLTLDSNAMLYRLNYENAQALHAYAQSRWSMPPAQLLALRIKARLGERGASVLAGNDGVKDLPVLRIELEEFAQHFDTSTHSKVQLQYRVSLLKKNSLLAQTQFFGDKETTTPDAQGGVAALPVLTDTTIKDLMNWLQTELQKAKP